IKHSFVEVVHSHTLWWSKSQTAEPYLLSRCKFTRAERLLENSACMTLRDRSIMKHARVGAIGAGYCMPSHETLPSAPWRRPHHKKPFCSLYAKLLFLCDNLQDGS